MEMWKKAFRYRELAEDLLKFQNYATFDMKGVTLEYLLAVPLSPETHRCPPDECRKQLPHVFQFPSILI
jgi:hypothetical protein